MAQNEMMNELIREKQKLASENAALTKRFVLYIMCVCVFVCMHVCMGVFMCIHK